MTQGEPVRDFRDRIARRALKRGVWGKERNGALKPVVYGEPMMPMVGAFLSKRTGCCCQALCR